jgi:hypothetical protein
MKNAFVSMFVVAASFAGSLAHANDLAYYQQFPYTFKEDADGNKTYRYLMSTELQGVEVGKIDLGTVYITMMLGLNTDGTFTAVFSEMTERFFPVDMHDMIKGNWSVPGDQLVLGDIAVGERAVFDGRNAIKLTFVKDLHTPGLKGKTMLFDYGFSNAAIDAFGFPGGGFPPIPGMPQ